MSNKRSMSNESASENGSQARSYPRKRVSIACEVCRLRKTRCDAARPACSFCADLGIECVYKRPTDASRPEVRSEDLTRALERLDRIEATLDFIASRIGTDSMNNFQPTSGLTPLTRVDSLPMNGTPLAFRHDQITPSPASVTTAGKRRYACKMPTLLSFKHPWSDHDEWSYNCTEEFFHDQMETIQDMRQHVFDLPLPEPDLSRHQLVRYQRAFADNALRWLPIFDHNIATQHLRYAQDTGHKHTGPSLCLVFLIYAIGAISIDQSLYSQSAHELPGFAYYAHAMHILERLSTPTKDLTVLQCHVLLTIYLLFAMRPLEAWRTITQASQECIVVLRGCPSIQTIHRKSSTYPGSSNGNSIENQGSDFRDAFNRIYWVCYVLESELEACLEVPSSGIRTYEAQVPLPTSHYEEEGLFFLLALSSLRRVMVEVLDATGYKSGVNLIPYNPAVALELRNQIDSWYHHLPAQLKFNLDQNQCLDMRRAYLRCSYYALMAVASWPFVLKISQLPPTSTPSLLTAVPHSNDDTNSMPPPQFAGNGHNNQASTPSKPLPPNTEPPAEEEIRAAEACLTACKIHITLSEEILTQKSLVAHLIVRQCYAFTVILLLNYDGVNLTRKESLDERRVLEQAMRTLEFWDVVPFMQGPLRELSRIGRAKGLAF